MTINLQRVHDLLLGTTTSTRKSTNLAMPSDLMHVLSCSYESFALSSCMALELCGMKTRMTSGNTCRLID